MIEHQGELRTALEKNSELQKRINELETTQTSDLERSTSSTSAQLEELQTQVAQSRIRIQTRTQIKFLVLYTLFVFRH